MSTKGIDIGFGLEKWIETGSILKLMMGTTSISLIGNRNMNVKDNSYQEL